jgi:hypothetical protein
MSNRYRDARDAVYEAHCDSGSVEESRLRVAQISGEFTEAEINAAHNELADDGGDTGYWGR